LQHSLSVSNQLASRVGVCPERQESTGLSSSDRSAKDNRSMVGSSINSLTLQSGNRIANFRLFSAAYPHAWDMPKPSD
jgi:hypothetical protein